MSGKEAISNHMMYHGAAENKNAVTMVTTREPSIHILETFKFKENNLTYHYQGWDLRIVFGG